jgi:hypothetical protein
MTSTTLCALRGDPCAATARAVGNRPHDAVVSLGENKVHPYNNSSARAGEYGK